MPQFLEPLYEHFRRLHQRRQYGYAAPQPLTYLEIDAYSRLTGAAFDPWEVEVLCRLDDAALEAQAKRIAKPGSSAEESAQIPVSNVAGVRALLRGLAAQKAAKQAATVPQPEPGGGDDG